MHKREKSTEEEDKTQSIAELIVTCKWDRVRRKLQHQLKLYACRRVKFSVLLMLWLRIHFKDKQNQK